MNTVNQGHRAEAAVAMYLKSCGYSIIDINWSTSRCEIDVIAKKDETIYFVEVKYRANFGQGDGFDYLTPKKLKQMTYAAETWVQALGWSGDYQLMGAAVTGLNNEEIELLEV